MDAGQMRALILFSIPVYLLQQIFIILFNYELLLFLLEKAVAPHSSTLARKIPWTEEPDGLQSMGS